MGKFCCFDVRGVPCQAKAPARLPGLRRCARLAEPANGTSNRRPGRVWLPKDSMPRRCIGELAEFLFKHRGQSDTSVNKECSEYAQRVGSSPAISASLDRNWRTMGFQELYEKWVTVVPYCPCTEVYHGRLLCGQRLMPDHGTGPCKACLARGVTVLTHKTVRQAEGGKQAEVAPVDLDYLYRSGQTSRRISHGSRVCCLVGRIVADSDPWPETREDE